MRLTCWQSIKRTDSGRRCWRCPGGKCSRESGCLDIEDIGALAGRPSVASRVLLTLAPLITRFSQYQ
eukprot:11436959-Prorocentrum_lima.AAC.1